MLFLPFLLCPFLSKWLRSPPPNSRYSTLLSSKSFGLGFHFENSNRIVVEQQQVGTTRKDENNNNNLLIKQAMEEHFLSKFQDQQRFHQRLWEVVYYHHPLNHLLQQLPHRCMTSGKLFKIIPLHLKGGVGGEGGNGSIHQEAGSILDPNLPLLLSHISKGKEIGVDLSSVVDSMKSTIQSFLGDDDEKSLEIVFNKMIICDKNGQVESPRGANNISIASSPKSHYTTLFIEVYSEHEGGDLLFQKDGFDRSWSLSSQNKEKEEEKVPNSKYLKETLDEEEEEFPLEFEKKEEKKEIKIAEEEEAVAVEEESIDETETNPRDVSWCLFSPDIQPKLTPVTSGHRLVLQFDVLSKDSFDEEELKKERSKRKRKNWRKFPLSNFLPIEENSLVVPVPSILNKIIDVLKEKVTFKHAIGLPLYSLYSSKSILPSFLKGLDYHLFQTFLDEGFAILLLPIELVSECTGASYVDIEINVYDFPTSVYFRDVVTNEMKKRKMSQWPNDDKKRVSLSFILSGNEAISLIPNVGYADYSTIEEHFLSGVMIIMKRPSKY